MEQKILPRIIPTKWRLVTSLAKIFNAASNPKSNKQSSEQLPLNCFITRFFCMKEQEQWWIKIKLQIMMRWINCWRPPRVSWLKVIRCSCFSFDCIKNGYHWLIFAQICFSFLLVMCTFLQIKQYCCISSSNLIKGTLLKERDKEKEDKIV